MINNTARLKEQRYACTKNGRAEVRGTHAALIGAPNVPLCDVPYRLISNLHNLVARIPPACKRSHPSSASCLTQGSLDCFPRIPDTSCMIESHNTFASIQLQDHGLDPPGSA